MIVDGRPYHDPVQIVRPHFNVLFHRLTSYDWNVSSYIADISLRIICGSWSWCNVITSLYSILSTFYILFRIEELSEKILQQKTNLKWGIHAVHGSIGCSLKNSKLVWRCHQHLSGFLAKNQLTRVSRQSLMIRVIMKWFGGLRTDLLAFALRLRNTPENLS